MLWIGSTQNTLARLFDPNQQTRSACFSYVRKREVQDAWQCCACIGFELKGCSFLGSFASCKCWSKRCKYITLRNWLHNTHGQLAFAGSLVMCQRLLSPTAYALSAYALTLPSWRLHILSDSKFITANLDSFGHICSPWIQPQLRYRNVSQSLPHICTKLANTACPLWLGECYCPLLESDPWQNLGKVCNSLCAKGCFGDQCIAFASAPVLSITVVPELDNNICKLTHKS